MKNLPGTINHPKAFERSPAAGFDGVFDWSWTEGCFGPGKIKPMDFDGVVERGGNFLVFETKDMGVPIPKGQLYTLQKIHELGVFTIMFIHGKGVPEAAQIWCPPDFKGGAVMGEFKEINIDRARAFCSDWYQYADSNKRQKVDVSFLNRRIQQLESVRDQLEEKITIATSFINKALEVLKD